MGSEIGFKKLEGGSLSHISAQQDAAIGRYCDQMNTKEARKNGLKEMSSQGTAETDLEGSPEINNRSGGIRATINPLVSFISRVKNNGSEVPDWQKEK